MKQYLFVALLIMAACGTTLKQDQTISGTATLIVKHEIDFKTMAADLIDICNTMMKNYTGADKQLLINQCSQNQLAALTQALQGAIDNLNANSSPIPLLPK